MHSLPSSTHAPGSFRGRVFALMGLSPFQPFTADRTYMALACRVIIGNLSPIKVMCIIGSNPFQPCVFIHHCPRFRPTICHSSSLPIVLIVPRRVWVGGLPDIPTNSARRTDQTQSIIRDCVPSVKNHRSNWAVAAIAIHPDNIGFVFRPVLYSPTIWMKKPFEIDFGHVSPHS